MKEVEISGCKIDPTLLIQLSNMLKDFDQNLVDLIWQIEQGSSLVTQYLSVIQAIKNNESPKFKIPTIEPSIVTPTLIKPPKRIRHRNPVKRKQNELSLIKTLMKLPVGKYKLFEITKFVTDADYQTTSENIQGLVYQKVCYLTREGIFKKYGLGTHARFENTNAPKSETGENNVEIHDSIGNG